MREVADRERMEAFLCRTRARSDGRHCRRMDSSTRPDGAIATRSLRACCADVLRRMQINIEFERQRIGDALERRDAEVPGRIFQRGGLLARHAEPLAELRL